MPILTYKTTKAEIAAVCIATGLALGALGMPPSEELKNVRRVTIEYKGEKYGFRGSEDYRTCEVTTYKINQNGNWDSIPLNPRIFDSKENAETLVSLCPNGQMLIIPNTESFKTSSFIAGISLTITGIGLMGFALGPYFPSLRRKAAKLPLHAAAGADD